MSPIGIASTLYSLFQSGQTATTAQLNSAGNKFSSTASGSDFSSSLAVRMASLQAQSVTSLIGSVFNGNKASSNFDVLSGTQSGATDAFSLPGLATTNQGLSASGRNISLFDPESAYRMMSLINTKDVTYKAQFSELSDMQTAVAGLQSAGQTLATTRTSMDNGSIKELLQNFAAEYNEWIKRFDETVKSNGVLAGTQAAEISLYELEQSVENVFNGARSGFHGMRDLGFSIDQSTNLATLNVSKLEAALSENKEGVVNTISEFSNNFAKSAELLNSANNFIPNRLANLDRVIDFISEKLPSLQSEFGLGDPAKPSAQVAKALAVYNQVFRS